MQVPARHDTKSEETQTGMAEEPRTGHAKKLPIVEQLAPRAQRHREASNVDLVSLPMQSDHANI